MAKNLILWVIIAIVLMSVFNNFTAPQVKLQMLSYSQFLDQVRQGQVKEVQISGRAIDGINMAGQRFSTYSCLLYTSPSPRDRQKSRMPSSA